MSIALGKEVLWVGPITLLNANANFDSLAMTDARGNPGKFNFSRYRFLSVWVSLENWSVVAGTPSVQVLIATLSLETPTAQVNNLNPGQGAWTGNNSYFSTFGPGTENGHEIGVIGKILVNVSGGTVNGTIWATIIGCP